MGQSCWSYSGSWSQNPWQHTLQLWSDTLIPTHVWTIERDSTDRFPSLGPYFPWATAARKARLPPLSLLCVLCSQSSTAQGLASTGRAPHHPGFVLTNREQLEEFWNFSLSRKTGSSASSLLESNYSLECQKFSITLFLPNSLPW